MNDRTLVEALEKQYAKTLAMLREAIEKYDEGLWLDEQAYRSPAWQIVYHLLFFANLYCAPAEASVASWAGMREGYHDHGGMARRRKEGPGGIIPYSKADMLEFARFFEERVPGYLEAFAPEARCWPFWYEEDQAEFHLNNLRHMQHHLGELVERHDIALGLEYGWK
jgi:hypothetical protein